MPAGRFRPGRLPALALTLALAASPAAWAQDSTPPMPRPDSPFLLINQERILTDSTTGKALLAEENRQRDALRAEARALDSSFETEERKLTEQRPTMAPEEFRKLSDAFDERVVKARRDQDARANALAEEFDQRRRQFYGRVAPVLVKLMDRYGARAIFDENTVLLADQSLNITGAVIAELDAQAGAPGAETGQPAPTDQGTAPTPPAEGTDGGN